MQRFASRIVVELQETISILLFIFVVISKRKCFVYCIERVCEMAINLTSILVNYTFRKRTVSVFVILRLRKDKEHLHVFSLIRNLILKYLTEIRNSMTEKHYVRNYSF